jgi:hypothetical protein
MYSFHQFRFRTIASAAALFLATACGGTTEPKSVMAFDVGNELLASVTVTPEGYPSVTLASGRTTVIQSTSATVSWARAPFALPDGSLISDDMMAGTATSSSGGTGGIAFITHTVNGVIYFTPHVTNVPQQTVALSIVNGGTERCLGAVLPSQSTAFLGYWRLVATTEARIYASTQCSGPFRSYASANLDPGANATGYVALYYPGP